MATWRGYRVTSGFGWRNNPLGSGREWHTGIDLVEKHKAPIKAFTGGRVLYAGEGKSGTGLGGYGNVVLIGDKYGHGQLYAHLDRAAVKTGEKISRGEVIGYQGATGQVTGSHLHFEVRKKAESSSPYGWRKDRKNNCVDPTDYIDNFKHSTKAPSNFTTHRVRSGDTLSEIAQEYGTTVDRIAKDNNISNPNLIKVGQNLKIAKGKGTVYFPPNKGKWRVYPTNVAPTVGNEKGKINPTKFGGLNYEILDEPQDNVVTIKTDDFGIVNVYVAPSTGAVVRK